MLPTTEPIVMIRPQRARTMPRRQARVTRNAPVRSVASTAAQSSSFIRIASVSRVMPALLTRISGRPSWSAITSSIAPTASGSATSAWIVALRRPSAAISAAAASAASRDRA